ncbi:MAG TPA: hypothetical protein VGF56_15160 [Rhizomicrobium sp.]|jgi:cell division protein FtsL
MVRILNFLFVALAGLSCFAMNHIAEKTRLADMELRKAHHQIADQDISTQKLQARWQEVANKDRIAKLAQEHLGLTDTPTVALASFETLPRRGELAPDNQVTNASLVTQTQQPALHLTAAH